MMGSCFLSYLSGMEDFEVFAFGREDLDVTDFSALEGIFKKIAPDIVINCTAYTDVDDCEKNKDLAFKVNGEAVGEIAKNCRRFNSVLIHFSTDYVFNGENSNGYKEDDIPSPVNAYGESKLKGERLIAENMNSYYIVRTSWLFGENGENFVDKMIKLGKNRKEIDVVSDQTGCPTYTHDLCKAVIEFFISPSIKNLSFGIYHITNSGKVSWSGFAKKIFEIMRMDVKINEISSDAFLTLAKRPKCSVLLNTKLLNIMRPWEEALKAYLNG